MTTSAAGNVAAHTDKDHKEKAEKRRALGRGLESLLPGPRVVPAAPGQAGGAAVRQQIPPFSRNDKTVEGRNDSAAVAGPTAGQPVVSSVDDGGAASTRAGVHPIVAQGGSAPQTSVTSAAVADVQSTENAGKRTGVSAPHESASHESAAYEPAYTDPAGDLAGRPATDPNGYQPPFDSSHGGTITIHAQAETRVPANLVINLAIADIDKNPFQTRYVEDDEKLEELSDSIKANGVVQPIMVRPSDEDDGRYVLILGERRLHASKKAGKTHIPAMVRRVSLQQAAEMTIVENLQREDLSALEQAEAFRVLSRDFALTQTEIGARVGLSRESVSNYMRLLKLPEIVMEQLAHKEFGFSEAKELLKLRIRS